MLGTVSRNLRLSERSTQSISNQVLLNNPISSHIYPTTSHIGYLPNSTFKVVSSVKPTNHGHVSNRRGFITRERQILKQGFDTPFNMSASLKVAPTYNQKSELKDITSDVRKIIATQIPTATLRKIGEKNLSGATLRAWNRKVSVIEEEMSRMAGEVAKDFKKQILTDLPEIQEFPDWITAVEVLLNYASHFQREEQLAGITASDVNFTKWTQFTEEYQQKTLNDQKTAMAYTLAAADLSAQAIRSNSNGTLHQLSDQDSFIRKALENSRFFLSNTQQSAIINGPLSNLSTEEDAHDVNGYLHSLESGADEQYMATKSSPSGTLQSIAKEKATLISKFDELVSLLEVGMVREYIIRKDAAEQAAKNIEADLLLATLPESASNPSELSKVLKARKLGTSSSGTDQALTKAIAGLSDNQVDNLISLQEFLAEFKRTSQAELADYYNANPEHREELSDILKALGTDISKGVIKPDDIVIKNPELLDTLKYHIHAALPVIRERIYENELATTMLQEAAPGKEAAAPEEDTFDHETERLIKKKIKHLIISKLSQIAPRHILWREANTLGKEARLFYKSGLQYLTRVVIDAPAMLYPTRENDDISERMQQFYTKYSNIVADIQQVRRAAAEAFPATKVAPSPIPPELLQKQTEWLAMKREEADKLRRQQEGVEKAGESGNVKPSRGSRSKSQSKAPKPTSTSTSPDSPPPSPRSKARKYSTAPESKEDDAIELQESDMIADEDFDERHEYDQNVQAILANERWEADVTSNRPKMYGKESKPLHKKSSRSVRELEAKFDPTREAEYPYYDEDGTLTKKSFRGVEPMFNEVHAEDLDLPDDLHAQIRDYEATQMKNFKDELRSHMVSREQAYKELEAEIDALWSLHPQIADPNVRAHGPRTSFPNPELQELLQGEDGQRKGLTDEDIELAESIMDLEEQLGLPQGTLGVQHEDLDRFDPQLVQKKASKLDIKLLSQMTPEVKTRILTQERDQHRLTQTRESIIEKMAKLSESESGDQSEEFAKLARQLTGEYIDVSLFEKPQNSESATPSNDGKTLLDDLKTPFNDAKTALDDDTTPPATSKISPHYATIDETGLPFQTLLHSRFVEYQDILSSHESEFETHKRLGEFINNLIEFNPHLFKRRPRPLETLLSLHELDVQTAKMQLADPAEVERWHTQAATHVSRLAGMLGALAPSSPADAISPKHPNVQQSDNLHFDTVPVGYLVGKCLNHVFPSKASSIVSSIQDAETKQRAQQSLFEYSNRGLPSAVDPSQSNAASISSTIDSPALKASYMEFFSFPGMTELFDELTAKQNLATATPKNYTAEPFEDVIDPSRITNAAKSNYYESSSLGTSTNPELKGIPSHLVDDQSPRALGYAPPNLGSYLPVQGQPILSSIQPLPQSPPGLNDDSAKLDISSLHEPLPYLSEEQFNHLVSLAPERKEEIEKLPRVDKNGNDVRTGLPPPTKRAALKEWLVDKNMPLLAAQTFELESRRLSIPYWRALSDREKVAHTVTSEALNRYAVMQNPGATGGMVPDFDAYAPDAAEKFARFQKRAEAERGTVGVILSDENVPEVTNRHKIRTLMRPFKGNKYMDMEPNDISDVIEDSDGTLRPIVNVPRPYNMDEEADPLVYATEVLERHREESSVDFDEDEEASLSGPRPARTSRTHFSRNQTRSGSEYIQDALRVGKEQDSSPSSSSGATISIDTALQSSNSAAALDYDMALTNKSKHLASIMIAADSPRWKIADKNLLEKMGLKTELLEFNDFLHALAEGDAHLNQNMEQEWAEKIATTVWEKSQQALMKATNYDMYIKSQQNAFKKMVAADKAKQAERAKQIAENPELASEPEIAKTEEDYQFITPIAHESTEALNRRVHLLRSLRSQLKRINYSEIGLEVLLPTVSQNALNHISPYLSQKAKDLIGRVSELSGDEQVELEQEMKSASAKMESANPDAQNKLSAEEKRQLDIVMDTFKYFRLNWSELAMKEELELLQKDFVESQQKLSRLPGHAQRDNLIATVLRGGDQETRELFLFTPGITQPAKTGQGPHRPGAATRFTAPIADQGDVIDPLYSKKYNLHNDQETIDALDQLEAREFNKTAHLPITQESINAETTLDEPARVPQRQTFTILDPNESDEAMLASLPPYIFAALVDQQLAVNRSVLEGTSFTEAHKLGTPATSESFQHALAQYKLHCAALDSVGKPLNTFEDKSTSDIPTTQLESAYDQLSNPEYLQQLTNEFDDIVKSKVESIKTQRKALLLNGEALEARIKQVMLLKEAGKRKALSLRPNEEGTGPEDIPTPENELLNHVFSALIAQEGESDLDATHLNINANTTDDEISAAVLQDMQAESTSFEFADAELQEKFTKQAEDRFAEEDNAFEEAEFKLKQYYEGLPNIEDRDVPLAVRIQSMEIDLESDLRLKAKDQGAHAKGVGKDSLIAEMIDQQGIVKDLENPPVDNPLHPLLQVDFSNPNSIARYAASFPDEFYGEDGPLTQWVAVDSHDRHVHYSRLPENVRPDVNESKDYLALVQEYKKGIKIIGDMDSAIDQFVESRNQTAPEDERVDIDSHKWKVEKKRLIAEFFDHDYFQSAMGKITNLSVEQLEDLAESLLSINADPNASELIKTLSSDLLAIICHPAMHRHDPAKLAQIQQRIAVPTPVTPTVKFLIESFEDPKNDFTLLVHYILNRDLYEPEVKSAMNNSSSNVEASPTTNKLLKKPWFMDVFPKLTQHKLRHLARLAQGGQFEELRKDLFDMGVSYTNEEKEMYAAIADMEQQLKTCIKGHQEAMETMIETMRGSRIGRPSPEGRIAVHQAHMKTDAELLEGDINGRRSGHALSQTSPEGILLWSRDNNPKKAFLRYFVDPATGAEYTIDLQLKRQWESKEISSEIEKLIKHYGPTHMFQDLSKEQQKALLETGADNPQSKMFGRTVDQIQLQHAYEKRSLIEDARVMPANLFARERPPPLPGMLKSDTATLPEYLEFDMIQPMGSGHMGLREPKNFLERRQVFDAIAIGGPDSKYQYADSGASVAAAADAILINQFTDYLPPLGHNWSLSEPNDPALKHWRFFTRHSFSKGALVLKINPADFTHDGVDYSVERVMIIMFEEKKLFLSEKILKQKLKEQDQTESQQAKTAYRNAVESMAPTQVFEKAANAFEEATGTRFEDLAKIEINEEDDPQSILEQLEKDDAQMFSHGLQMPAGFEEKLSDSLMEIDPDHKLNYTKYRPPEYRQRLFEIPRNLLLSLKRISWPETQDYRDQADRGWAPHPLDVKNTKDLYTNQPTADPHAHVQHFSSWIDSALSQVRHMTKTGESLL